MKKITTIIAAMLATATMSAQTLTGREIAEKVHNRPDGDTRYCEMSLTLVNKNGSKRVRELKSFAKDYGKDRKTIMFFLYPGDVKGTGFLTWEYDQIDRDDDKWLYLPAMKKTRRISGSSSKTDYFMGTDFTYDDMGHRNTDEDTHTLLREETIDGQACWVLQSVPNTTGEIYTRRVSWIRKDCLIPVRVEYYDKLDKLHRLPAHQRHARVASLVGTAVQRDNRVVFSGGHPHFVLTRPFAIGLRYILRSQGTAWQHSGDIERLGFEIVGVERYGLRTHHMQRAVAGRPHGRQSVLMADGNLDGRPSGGIDHCVPLSAIVEDMDCIVGLRSGHKLQRAERSIVVGEKHHPEIGTLRRVVARRLSRGYGRQQCQHPPHRCRQTAGGIRFSAGG